MVTAASSTFNDIITKVRRLTASASEASLSTSEIQRYVNTFYSQDFPYAVKLDQIKEVYTFYTSPNIDKYNFDINSYQGVRDPVFFQGIRGTLFKDRTDFYKVWYRTPTLGSGGTGDGVTTAFAWTSGAIPFYSNSLVIGTTDISGAPIRCRDDGNGVVQYITTDSVGNNSFVNVGTVDYVTGYISVDFSLATVTPASAADITVWVSAYQPGRPYNVLFWKDFFIVRPVPDKVYKVELEAYQCAMQFTATTENPIIKQWWQYLSLGTAREILRDRGDVEGVENLREGFERQEALVLERQAIEEIGSCNTTIYNSPVGAPGFANGYGGYY